MNHQKGVVAQVAHRFFKGGHAPKGHVFAAATASFPVLSTPSHPVPTCVSLSKEQSRTLESVEFNIFSTKKLAKLTSV